MTDDRDFTSYVAARWTRLVRCLLAVGAPLDLAHRVASDTLSSCHDDWASRDDWSDLDVHVVEELLDRWDRQPGGWWEQPAPRNDVAALEEAGWPEVEGELDRLPVPERRALVLSEVAGLSPAQVREVTGVEHPRADAALVTAVLDALDLVPVDAPRVESMVAASELRGRRRRGATLVGAVALLSATVVVTALVLRQPEQSSGGGEFDRARSIPYDNPAPIAWYSAGKLRLEKTQVSLRDVRAFGQWDRGAVYLDVRGNLVTVGADGERERIATPGPGTTFGVSDSADVVAWVDPDGPELVLHNLRTGERRLKRTLASEAARIVSTEGHRALLAVDDDLFEVDLYDGSIEPAADERLPGELDRHGRYALIREGGGGPTARIRLLDTSTSRPLPLSIGATRDVGDARFGPDASVVVLYEPSGSDYAEVRRCAPPYEVCELLAYYPSGGARSLLAQ